MRPDLAGASASAARSMSRRPARARPQTVLSVTTLATSRTASKSPFDAMGKPASITSTLISSRVSAIRSFSSRFIDAPGDCSPSRIVVSNIRTRFPVSVITGILSPRRLRRSSHSPGQRPRARRTAQGRLSRSPRGMGHAVAAAAHESGPPAGLLSVGTVIGPSPSTPFTRHKQPVSPAQGRFAAPN